LFTVCIKEVLEKFRMCQWRV